MHTCPGRPDPVAQMPFPSGRVRRRRREGERVNGKEITQIKQLAGGKNDETLGIMSSSTGTFYFCLALGTRIVKKIFMVTK